MPELGALVALMALATAPAASDGLQPAPTAQIGAAAADCWQAMGSKGVDPAVLTTRGWAAGKFMKDNKPVRGPMTPYGKKGQNVLIMALASDKAPSCSVTARFVGQDQGRSLVVDVVKQLKAVEPNLKAVRQGKALAFIAGSRVALLEAGGNKDATTARIIVGYTPAEKK